MKVFKTRLDLRNKKNSNLKGTYPDIIVLASSQEEAQQKAISYGERKYPDKLCKILYCKETNLKIVI